MPAPRLVRGPLDGGVIARRSHGGQAGAGRRLLRFVRARGSVGVGRSYRDDGAATTSQARGLRRAIHDAYNSPSPAAAKGRVLALVNQLEADHPGAASSLREGLDETLTVKGMKLQIALQRTLSTTNPIPSRTSTVEFEYGFTLGGAVGLAMVEAGEVVAVVSIKPMYDPEMKRIKI